MKTIKKSIFLPLVIFTMLVSGFKTSDAQTLDDAKNGIAFIEQDKFGGWPANNGLWTWNNGQEILQDIPMVRS
jgi:hypothetical protein